MTTSTPQPGSRRVDVEIYVDKPVSREEWELITGNPGVTTERLDELYRKYIGRHQPYRWRAVAANNEVVAYGERYFNLADCINAVELNYGDNTTMYRMPMFGEDRSETLLRYGKTDREHQQ